MSDNYRDKIQEIRARRRGGVEMPKQYQANGTGVGEDMGINQVGAAGINRASSNITGQTTQTRNNAAIPQQEAVESPFGPDFKSPWLRDRVSLSLEGQIAMMEMRGNQKVNSTDLGYTNRSTVLPIRSGIFVKVEPPGTYKLSYNNR
jgi:hypothetical protein